MAKPNSNPLADRESVVTDEEAKALLQQFFSALSPTERRRMYCCTELHARGGLEKAKGQGRSL